MFSVIIPLYNKGIYIEKCLKSLRNQTFKAFEVIVVNDGSTDNGLQVVEKLIKEFNDDAENVISITVISQQNKGVSSARNLGVLITNYDYLVFLDADDWWEDNYLEEMKGLIERYPDAGIFSSYYYIYKNTRRRIDPIGVHDGFVEGYINYFLVYAKTLSTPVLVGATVIRKKVFQEFNGFNPNLKLGEDSDLWIRVHLKYKVAFLNKPLTYYNFDVDPKTRAIGNDKLYEKGEYMLFNMNYVNTSNNQDLHNLFERLCVYNLVPYYIHGKNKVDVTKLLINVDWNSYPIKYRLIYKKAPIWILVFWMSMMKYGSICKQFLIRMSHRCMWLSKSNN